MRRSLITHQRVGQMKIEFTSLEEKYLEELVRIHRDTFKDHFNSKLGDFHTREYLKWFSKESSNENFITCAIDRETDTVVGYICGARIGYQTDLNRKLIFPAILGFLRNPLLLFDKRVKYFIIPKIRTLIGSKEFAKITEYEKKFPDPLFSVASFGINPTIKGNMNLGLIILENLYKEFFKEARKRKAKTIRATVRVDNKRIIEYYKLKKWELAPITESNNSIFFYKVID